MKKEILMLVLVFNLFISCASAEDFTGRFIIESRPPDGLKEEAHKKGSATSEGWTIIGNPPVNSELYIIDIKNQNGNSISGTYTSVTTNGCCDNKLSASMTGSIKNNNEIVLNIFSSDRKKCSCDNGQSISSVITGLTMNCHKLENGDLECIQGAGVKGIFKRL
ncbi:MAG: hypothetical protein HQK99_17410 [Nitrospirae bacterium]|nr:hypothetical protein [Nitrospirota bacterium]